MKPTQAAQQHNQLPLDTQPGPPHTVQSEPAEPMPREPEPARPGTGQLAAEQRDTAPLFTPPPERQEQAGFTWEAKALQLIELLVIAVVKFDEIPDEKAIKNLLVDCDLRHLADRLSERPSRAIEGTQRAEIEETYDVQYLAPAPRDLELATQI